MRWSQFAADALRRLVPPLSGRAQTLQKQITFSSSAEAGQQFFCIGSEFKFRLTAEQIIK